MNYSGFMAEGSGEPVLLLAHGAGAPADSTYMEALSASLAARGLTVLRFEFPYMQQRRQDGRKRPPGAATRLQGFYLEEIRRLRTMVGPQRPLFIGGKSMGGRIASLVAAAEGPDADFAGTVCFGYPFHPPGKPSQWRTSHFREFGRPVCIIQGTRDPFGKPDEVAEHPDIPVSVEISWLEGGDHDLCPLRKQNTSQGALIDSAAEVASDFMTRSLLRR